MLIILALAICPSCIMVWAGLQHLGVVRPIGEKGVACTVHFSMLAAGILTIPVTVFSLLYMLDMVARYGEVPVDLPDRYYEPGASDVFFLEWLGEAHALFLAATVQFLICLLAYFSMLKHAARKRAILLISLALFAFALASFAIQARFPTNW